MTEEAPPVARKIVTYSTEVDDLSAAFSFLMSHLDEFKTPSISIEAVKGLGEDEEDSFEVELWGDVEG